MAARSARAWDTRSFKSISGHAPLAGGQFNGIAHTPTLEGNVKQGQIRDDGKLAHAGDHRPGRRGGKRGIVLKQEGQPARGSLVEAVGLGLGLNGILQL